MSTPTCQNCGTPVTPGGQFCISCGVSLSGEQVATLAMSGAQDTPSRRRMGPDEWALEQLREETRTAAEREAQVILREAETEGRQRLDAADRDEGHVRERMAEVQRQFAGYLAGFRALLERQQAELRALEGDRG